MSESYILCLHCRGTFTEEQCASGWGCPTCGSRSVPADARKKATLTLTHHEWRILFMWADNYAQQCAKADPASAEVARLVPGLIREAKRQAPDLPGLSMGEELQELANSFGKVEMHSGGGEVKVIEPEQKH